MESSLSMVTSHSRPPLVLLRPVMLATTLVTPTQFDVKNRLRPSGDSRMRQLHRTVFTIHEWIEGGGGGCRRQSCCVLGLNMQSASSLWTTLMLVSSLLVHLMGSLLPGVLMLPLRVQLSAAVCSSEFISDQAGGGGGAVMQMEAGGCDNYLLASHTNCTCVKVQIMKFNKPKKGNLITGLDNRAVRYWEAHHHQASSWHAV